MARGVLTVTVPGAAWGWQEVLDKYGTMKFKQVLEPAAQYAEQGFPVSERIASDWHLPKSVNANRAQLENCCSDIDPDSIATWYINGKPPVAGQIYKNPDLAKTFRILEAKGRDGFYKGPVAEALVKKVRALGGTMTVQDLADYKGEWVEPVTSEYHGYMLAELPPPSQGFAANEMLNILSTCTGKVYPGQTLASLGPRDARYWHLLIEAKALAYADLNQTNGDPNMNPNMAAQVQSLLSPAHTQALCAKISPDKAMPAPGPGVPTGGDTIVLSTADRWGNMVSWVNSNYSNFGSGITVPGYGFILHNRGGLFTLDPNSPNVIAPHKRPYNTLAAAFVMQGGRTDGQVMALQLMGGDMQSQGHAQVLVDMIDLGANLQAASDMARFHHNQVNGTVSLESEAFKLVGQQLIAMGHKAVSANGSGMGGYEALLFTPAPGEPKPDGKRPVNGSYRAGTDHRKDGMAIGW
jgi:gamma-glutamyltranspeptidase/glutathione hydrolase